LGSSAIVEKGTTNIGLDGLTQIPVYPPHETMTVNFYVNPLLPNENYDLEMRNNYILSTFDTANQSLTLVESTLLARLRASDYEPDRVNAAEYIYTTLGLVLTEIEISFLYDSMNTQKNYDEMINNGTNLTICELYYNKPILYALSMIISTRTGIRWSNKINSGLDVNVYAIGPGSTAFIGNYENTEIAKRIAKLMGWNLAAITNEITNQGLEMDIED